MKHQNTAQIQTVHRGWPIALAGAIAGLVSLPQLGHAAPATPPPVPPEIRVGVGYKAFLKAHALGTQNYVCLPSEQAPGFAWTFFGPQATLFNDRGNQVITHFLSPNPFEDREARVTWQHSRDSSTVWAKALRTSVNPAFVAPGAIPWLLAKWVGSQDGPNGGHTLTPTAYIQRLNTSGGVAPATGCSEATDVGKKALSSYEADYFFYKPADSRY